LDVDFAIVSPIEVVRATQTSIFFIGIIAIVEDVELASDVAFSKVVKIDIDFVSSTPDIGRTFDTGDS
jgi:hypothetical protein